MKSVKFKGRRDLLKLYSFDFLTLSDYSSWDLMLLQVVDLMLIWPLLRSQKVNKSFLKLEPTTQ